MHLKSRIISGVIHGLIGSIGLIIAGCETIPDSAFPRDGEDERVVRRLVADGRFEAAAEEYLRMAAKASSPRADDYRLAAVENYLDAGDPHAAEALLAKFATARWTTGQKAYRHLLMARIAVVGRRPRQAFVSLEKIYSSDCNLQEIRVPAHLPSHCGPAPALPEPLWADFFRTRSLAHAALGGDNAFQAIRDRVALDMLLSGISEIEANHRAIWSLLSSLPVGFLSRAYLWPPESWPSDAPVPLRVEVLQGWLTLVGIMKRHVSQETSPYAGTLARALASWRERHPDHPAGRFLLRELMAIARQKPPAHIALLLPLDGHFSGAARAIHDGFLSAWLRDNGDADRPTITIRNTVGPDIPALYDEVIGAGAEFVVGPLDKPAVARLEELPVLLVPTLALNDAARASARTSVGTSGDGAPRTADLPPVSDGGSETGAPTEFDVPLYRFTLAPESEAEQVARRARRDGHSRAAILTPRTPWGQRMEGAFATAWDRLGGTVVASRRFPDTLEKIAVSVKKLVAETGHRDSEPKRHGMDCILLAAFPREARQLRPQLEFHYAGNVPVYATSHVFAGIADPVLDQDIDGVVFGDMPWVLRKPEGETALRGVVATAWPEFSARYLRYYAFGIDAYRIISRLEGLRTGNLESFRGETGTLSVDSEGRVERELLWARIHRGKPIILE